MISLTFREQLPPIVAQELDIILARLGGVIDETTSLTSVLADVTALQASDADFVTHSTGALVVDRLVIANGSRDIKTLGSAGTTVTVLHGNAAGAPTFGAVVLTTDVSGILPLANGGTGAALSGLAAGTYTPTLANSVNVAASTVYDLQYVRVGAIVTVSGKVDIDPTAAGDTQLGISLPVASNFGNDYEAGGAASAPVVGESGAILADATNNRATLRFQAVSTANNSWWFSFTYQII